MKQDNNVQSGVHDKIQILVNVPSYNNQFVSRVGFRHCLIDVSIFAVFPIVVNLICKLPCGGILQGPGP